MSFRHADARLRGLFASLREDCQAARNCPLKGDADAGMEQMKNFDRLYNTPLQTSDPNRTWLTHDLAMSAVVGAAVLTQTYSIHAGMQQALNSEDGSTLLYVADLLSERNKDGSYSSNLDETRHHKAPRGTPPLSLQVMQPSGRRMRQHLG